MKKPAAEVSLGPNIGLLHLFVIQEFRVRAFQNDSPGLQHISAPGDHQSHSGVLWKLSEEASDSKGIERDADIQNKLLSILYVKRRQNISDPGIGNLELEHLLGCPAEHLEFHIWYLKEKGWIGRTESGTIAITVEGVDRANSANHRNTSNKLLADQNHRG